MLTAVARRTVAAAVVLLGSISLVAQTSHKVTRIVDGDTLVLSEIGTVRLIGVDTPEIVDPRKPVEEFGRQSSAFLTGLALGKTVRVEYDQTRKDRYNRTLAYLYLEDGRFVNKEIVRQGYGHAYVKYPFKHMEEFKAAAQEAQRENLGLWRVRLSPADITTLSSTTAPLGLLGAVASAGAAGAVATAPSRGNGDLTVYVTKTGEKYHSAGCRSLSKSQIPMALKDAATRYGPCSICRPPVLSESSSSPSSVMPLTSSPRASTPAPRATSQQCAATTKAGARCKRTASAGSAYCWQHGSIH